VFDAYLAYEYHFAAVQLALAMLGMGATLGVQDFLDVFREPRAFALGMVAQLVAVPLVALAFFAVLPLDPGLAVGIALVAAVPGGSLSNVVTHLARGNTPLSISLTAACTLASLVTTPWLLAVLAPPGLAASVAMPVGRIAFEIAACLLVPLAAGMIIGAAFPRRRGSFSRWCIGTSLAVIGAMIVGAAGAGRIDAQAYGWIGPGLIVAFAAAAQVAARLLSRASGLGPRDEVAVGIEVTIRNTNLGLLVKASVLPAAAGVTDPVADGALFVVLLYGGAALLVALPLIRFGRRTAGAGAPGGEAESVLSRSRAPG
jgi:BASS family bile acid:Na+ symporter